MGTAKHSEYVSTEVLFRRHANFVARFLRRLGVPPEHLEDALQEVFLVVHRNGGYRAGLAKPTSYLASIAIYKAAAYRRRRQVAFYRQSDAAVEQMPSTMEDPANKLQTQQDLKRLQLALDQLPDELCTTLLLVDMEGESCVSVAAGMGCPVGTVYWRLHQARKKLHRALKAIDAGVRSPLGQPGKKATSPSWLVFLGLPEADFAETADLLRLAREQPVLDVPIEELLARHHQVISQGLGSTHADSLMWASQVAPPTTSWLALAGWMPIAAGAAMTALAVAALVVWPPAWMPSGSDDTQAEARTAETGGTEHARTAAVHDQIEENANVAAQTLTPTAPVGRTESVQSGHARLHAALPQLHAEPTDSPVSGKPSEPPAVRRQRQAKSRPELGSPAPAGRALPTASFAGISRGPTLTGGRAAAQRAASRVGAEQASPREQASQSGRQDKSRPEAATVDSESQPAAAETTSTSPSLQKEAAYLELGKVARAERLLAAQPESALALLHSMNREHSTSYFRQEREYLEVVALYRLARHDAVQSKATAFLERYPDGTYSEHVRRVLRSGGEEP